MQVLIAAHVAVAIGLGHHVHQGRRKSGVEVTAGGRALSIEGR